MAPGAARPSRSSSAIGPAALVARLDPVRGSAPGRAPAAPAEASAPVPPAPSTAAPQSGRQAPLRDRSRVPSPARSAAPPHGGGSPPLCPSVSALWRRAAEAAESYRTRRRSMSGCRRAMHGARCRPAVAAAPEPPHQDPEALRSAEAATRTDRSLPPNWRPPTGASERGPSLRMPARAAEWAPSRRAPSPSDRTPPVACPSWARSSHLLRRSVAERAAPRRAALRPPRAARAERAAPPAGAFRPGSCGSAARTARLPADAMQSDRSRTIRAAAAASSHAARTPGREVRRPDPEAHRAHSCRS